MRIGEFARKHNVTIDAVRHYMDLELVIPDKSGGHYSFGEGCSRDLQEVLWYKGVGFSLAEVEKIFLLKRFIGVKSSEGREHLKSMLLQKRDELLNERARLEYIIEELSKRAGDIWDDEQVPKKKLGLPLTFIQYLSCPECSSSLGFKKGEIIDNMVMEGELGCVCGFKCEVDDGILKIREKMNTASKPEGSLDKWDYLEKTAPEFINFMYKGQEWMAKKAIQNPQSIKIIMEVGTGHGIFINHFHSQLPRDSFYIAVDNSLEGLAYTKSYLEENSMHDNFIFICTDFSYLPIADKTVDMVMDFIGTSDFCFKTPALLTGIVSKKVRPHGLWNEAGFYFMPESKSLRKIEMECRKLFYMDNIKETLESGDFKTLDWEELGYAERVGEYEPFFIDGDRVYMFGYLGEKTSG